MKMSELLQVGNITPLTAEEALAEVRQCIAETELNLHECRKYIAAHPRAFGLTRVQARHDEARSLLRGLKRREQACLRVISLP